MHAPRSLFLFLGETFQSPDAESYLGTQVDYLGMADGVGHLF